MSRCHEDRDALYESNLEAIAREVKATILWQSGHHKAAHEDWCHFTEDHDWCCPCACDAIPFADDTYRRMVAADESFTHPATVTERGTTRCVTCKQTVKIEEIQ